MDEQGLPEAGKHAGDFGTLTAREREVLELALSGLSAPAIAERLTLTEATVRSHLSRIYAKTGVRGRVELLARARDHAFADRHSARGRSDLPAIAPLVRRRGLATFTAVLGVIGVALTAFWLRPGGDAFWTPVGMLLAAIAPTLLVVAAAAVFLAWLRHQRWWSEQGGPRR